MAKTKELSKDTRNKIVDLHQAGKTESAIEQLQVIGPEAPLVAVAGEDLVLPCFIKPNTSAVDMSVEWLRLEEGVSIVHLYRAHEDKNENQAQSYRGRTSLFKEELQKGNASLKLSAFKVSDAGEYKCLIEDKSWYDDITVHVIVEVLGSHPVIMMESYDNSGGIHLVCESRGWNPEPEVLWLDREGATLPAEDTQIHRDTEGFSVKRRITVYESNRFYCRLQQKHHMMETNIIINTLSSAYPELQSKQGCPDFTLPRHFLQLFWRDPEVFPGQPRDKSLSSVSWVSFRWGIPGTPPQGDTQEASETDAQATSTVPFRCGGAAALLQAPPG
ncbi:hypothetical protein QTP86_005599 [Hemibagrus guttatus]|nr:hypothetical protein QTP86_005599 [Hemibagrus guttatus]